MDRKKIMMIVNAGVSPYSNKVLATQAANLIAYWPLTDTVGTTTGVAELKNGFTGTAGANVTFGQPGISTAGKTASLHAGTTASANIALYSTALRDVFNGAELTIACWATVSDTFWTDGAAHGIFIFRADVNNRVYFQKLTTDNQVTGAYLAGGTLKSVVYATSGPATFFHLALTISAAADELKLYYNGAQVGSTQTGLGTWVGSIATGVCWLGGYSGIFYHAGKVAHAALWSAPLTPAEVASLAVPFEMGPSDIYIHAVGDSKTAAAPGWPDRLPPIMRGHVANRVVHISRHAGGGLTTQDIANTTAGAGVAPLVAAGVTPSEVCINLGANDVNSVPDKDTIKQSFLDVASPYHVAFPAANIRLAKIWRRNTGVQAAGIVVLNTAIDELYAANAWLKPAIDEADFLEGGDDGVTYTSDGTHPNDAGYALEAEAWVTAMGY